jgi:hydroxylysine kinase
VYGIPGFESGGAAESFDFEHLSEEAAIGIASRHFGIAATSALRLDTERDDSFRLETADGIKVLKVAHPADSIGTIEVQLRAVRYVEQVDASLPLQRIVETPSGRLCLSLPGGRVACMLEWLPGDLLRFATTGPHELAALGDALGRLSKALVGYTNPDAARLSAWELRTVPRLTTILKEVPDAAAAEAIDRYNARVVPRIHELPLQVVHNDFNPGNVLVDPADPAFVVGILDFGDVIYSFRVADLAIALSYQVFPFGHGWDELAPMIEAFERHVPLSDFERELLPTLVGARFAQRILINQWLSLQDHEPRDDYDEIVGALADLLTLEP